VAPSYKGRVEVYFGSKVAPPSSPFSPQPNVVIDAVNLLTNFGTVLATGDVNGDGNLDLIVGSPIARGDPSQGSSAIQRGVVNVFFSGSSWVSGLHTNDSVADITLYGQDQFAWFGSSITVCDWNNWVSRASGSRVCWSSILTCTDSLFCMLVVDYPCCRCARVSKQQWHDNCWPCVWLRHRGFASRRICAQVYHHG
jgi:hypothetical protein